MQPLDVEYTSLSLSYTYTPRKGYRNDSRFHRYCPSFLLFHQTPQLFWRFSGITPSTGRAGSQTATGGKAAETSVSFILMVMGVLVR